MGEKVEMREPYLQVTYRRGRLLAAYLYLPREPGDRSVRTAKLDFGLIADFGPGGRPIGIEFTFPQRVTLGALNRVLAGLGVTPLSDADLAPLRAAC